MVFELQTASNSVEKFDESCMEVDAKGLYVCIPCGLEVALLSSPAQEFRFH